MRVFTKNNSVFITTKSVNGTSFAAAKITGAAALAKQFDKRFTAPLFMQFLRKAAIDYGDEGYDTSYGYGLLDFDIFRKALVSNYSLLVTEKKDGFVTVCNLSDNDVTAKVLCTGDAIDCKEILFKSKITSKPATKDLTYRYEEETLEVLANDGVNTINLTDDVLANETNNLRIRIGDVLLTLDNNTVEKIKKSENRAVSIVQTDDKISIDVCGLEQVQGLVSYKPSDKGNLTETNAVVTKNGEVITNSYYDGNNVLFAFNANGDYVIETRSYDFGDTASSWAKDYISFVAVRGKINGVGNDQFAPNKNVTRAEFLKMIFGALNIEADAAEISASDVSADDWYAPFVAFAMQNGIVKGYEDGTFKPNNEISREEMMVILNRCIEYKGIEAKAGKISFSDKSDISDWAKDAVANITALGLITGNDDGTLKAHSKTKRCECAVIMMRCIKLVTNNMIQ